MNNSTQPGLSPQQVLGLFKRHRRLWLIPTIVGAFAGVVVAVFMPRYWEATQTLIVRGEATSNEQRMPGKFSSLADMKTFQETLLEVAKSKSVVEATLTEIGPPRGWSRDNAWPTDRVIEDFRDQISLSPPKGAEFGKTEVSYLTVREKGKERAFEIVASLCVNLDQSLRNLRDAQAQSLTDELVSSAAAAEANLKEASITLAEFEKKVGADLSELRMLQNSPSATSDLRQNLVATENALQLHETKKRQGETLLVLLRAAHADPSQLIATPNSLLESQPALKRLKDGLIDAKLNTAKLRGSRTERHPEVLAAQDAVEKIHDHLFKELDVAISGLEVDLVLSDDRVTSLKKKIAEGRDRLGRLAGLRAEYAILVGLVDDRTKQVETARRDLATARSAQASARSASLIQRIDGPEAGVNPVGPGRTVVATAGLFGGFFIGLGLLFLLAEPSANGGNFKTTLARDSANGTNHTPRAENEFAGSTCAASSDSTANVFGMFRGMSLRDALHRVSNNEEKTS